MTVTSDEPLGRNGTERAATSVSFDDSSQHSEQPGSTARHDSTPETHDRPQPSTDTVVTTPPSTISSSGGPPMSPAGPIEPGGLFALEAELALAALRPWPLLPPADVDAAVEAGMLVAASVAHTDQPVGSGQPIPTDKTAYVMTVAVANAAAALQRQGLPPDATNPVDWNSFGTVIPVLAGSPGAGASTLAALLADVLQLGQQRVLLIDPADPPRSGLGAAARVRGPWLTRPHPQVHIRYSWRAQALLAQLETSLPVIAPGGVPPPRLWRPPGMVPQITVVDLGHDPWRVTAHPMTGAGAWLRRGIPQPRPMLVVRPSRPSLLHAEQVLARLDHWISNAVAAAPVQLVVMGAKRWPAGVAGAAGLRVQTLMPDAVFVPYDSDLAAAGITSAVTPPRLRQALTPMLRRCGLLPDTAAHGRRSSTRRRS
ncbi:hypothetical protein [Umezawaea sp. Da 62-37]|uniref:hypothetical protein n=1 Tax=Umezawaea sp. Da 62-37 TaxID=3075927 RepID=UPI0028F71E2C|nr:hypothetical protein [Umezawaea sp. Da 62-37]WNV83165.1 hypothetical protein RM788_33945 [Umezawaea sp. Da 62-37]